MTDKFDVVRMPSDPKDMSELLEEFAPFLDAMYDEKDTELYGEVNFLLDYWLFLWDTGTGFFLTKRDENADLTMVALITKYRDIWHGRERLEIHRVALAKADGLDENKEIQSAVDYLVSVAPILKFDFLYFNTRDDKGNEFKGLMWSN